MAKKPPKETPHLRVRIEPRLLARLEKARERNGNTLTGEIVSRIEGAFVAEEKLATLEKNTSDLRQMAQIGLMALENTKKELEDEKKDMAALIQKLDASDSKMEKVARHVQDMEVSAKMVDLLLGEHKQKSKLLRRVALEIASWPQDWATNPSIKKEIEERFRSTFAAHIGEDAS